MSATTSEKASYTLETGRLIRLVRKDRAGRIVRISKHVEVKGKQKPLSEMIYYPNGRSTLYLYGDSGEAVEHVIEL